MNLFIISTKNIIVGHIMWLRTNEKSNVMPYANSLQFTSETLFTNSTFKEMSKELEHRYTVADYCIRPMFDGTVNDRVVTFRKAGREKKLK